MLAGVLSWFKALSAIGKVGVITAAAFTGMTGLAVISPEPTSNQVECSSTLREETETEVIKFETEKQDDSTLEKGKTEVRTKGVNGEKTITYEVTEYNHESCGKTTKSVAREKVTKEPVTEVVAVGTYVEPEPEPQVAPATNSAPAPEPDPAPSPSGVVKKSTSGVCHAPGTTYYDRTKNFTPFNSLQACLDSGGRRPLR